MQFECKHKPIVPDSINLSKFTFLPIILGAVLGIEFGASSLSLALKVGMTVIASSLTFVSPNIGNVIHMSSFLWGGNAMANSIFGILMLFRYSVGRGWSLKEELN